MNELRTMRLRVIEKGSGSDRDEWLHFYWVHDATGYETSTCCRVEKATLEKMRGMHDKALDRLDKYLNSGEKIKELREQWEQEMGKTADCGERAVECAEYAKLSDLHAALAKLKGQTDE